MNPPVQNPGESDVNAGLNNILAKETYAERVDSKVLESSDQATLPSPTEKPRYQLWPMIKKAVPSSGRSPLEMERAHELMTSQSSPSLRDFGSFVSAMRSKQQKEVPLIRRRKISFPDLGFGPMTTVQEHYIDSPTIPGRFPVHERSNSAPGTSWGRSHFEEIMLEPVAEPAILRSKQNDGASSSSNPDNTRQWKTVEYAPKSMFCSKKDLDSSPQRERPPAVPPKSPRMAMRTPPLTQAPTSKFRTPSPKPQMAPSIQIPHSTNQCSTPVSASSRSASPKHITHQWQKADPRPRAATALDGRRSPNEWQPLSNPNTPHHHKRSESASVLTGYVGSISERSHAARNDYIRNLSENLIMQRSRPPRKNRFLERQNSKRRPSADQISFLTLPLGLTPSDAFSVLSTAEVERLQEQARSQAQKFEVLKYSDVKALSQELRILDERCEYLRNTHNSLRAGRRSLHDRMITYLKSPSLSRFCRESMLKQEEALAELDQCIDEWVTKLELADNRRTRVRQKLLEHMAATLVLQTTNPEPKKSFDETPPLSPDGVETQLGMSRKDVESIKVYADSRVYADANVYALFADIEKEMELMTESRNGGSSRNATIV